MLMGCSFSSLSFANEEEYLFKGVSLFGEQNKQLDISKFQDSSYIEDGEYIWQAIVNEENNNGANNRSNKARCGIFTIKTE